MSASGTVIRMMIGFTKLSNWAASSTTFDALPLVLASGARAESRQAIGIVVVFGVAVSAAPTLFVVPLLARGARSPQHVARLIAGLRSDEALRSSEIA